MTRTAIVRCLVLVALLLPAALLPQAVSAQPRGPGRAAEAGGDVFDEIWQTVKDRFYDPSLRGLDWQAVREQVRPAYEAATDDAARRDVVNEMLDRLGASHTEYFVADEPQYFELTDLFSFAFRGRLNNFFPQGRVRYVGIGAYTTQIDGRIFVSGVLDGLPADRAGLRIGDEILNADGAPYRQIGSFAGKEGQRVTLTVRRHVGAAVEEVGVVPIEIHPAQSLLDAIDASVRIIDVGGKKIGYLHMWCYFGEAFQRLLEKELATRLRDADALVWDLRDGWGGTADGDLDIFNGREPTLEAIGRDGKPSFSNVKWLKPAVMLINGGTRSAKEIVAYGFKKYGLGEVVGSTTAKAVLGSRAFLMRDGSLLLLAVSDIKVDGERLEGVGVTPTIPVDAPLPYRDGADPQLDRALTLLGG